MPLNQGSFSPPQPEHHPAPNMQRPPSRSSTSTNTPLWPEGHPRHAVNSWLREQWGPQQSNTSMPSTASLPQQARRRKWSFNMGTSPFTSGYTRQPATPAYSPNIRDRRSSLSSMDSMPDLNHMHLESDPDDPQTATAQKFPTSSGQQIHDADSGIWHEMAELKAENDRLRELCGKLQAHCVDLESRLEHPVSSSQQPDPQTQTPSTDTSSEPSGGGGPERASHLSDIQATEQHVRFAAQAELHRQAAAAELRGKKGATGRPGSGSMGSASPPFQRTATEPSPRPNGRDPYWQHMRSDVQRQRELEQMAAARTQTQQTHRQMPLFPPYQAAFPGAQKAPMHEPLLQPQMPRARRSSTSSPDYFSFIRQQQGRPVPPAATPPLSGHSDYSDSDFEEGLYR